MLPTEDNRMSSMDDRCRLFDLVVLTVAIGSLCLVGLAGNITSLFRAASSQRRDGHGVPAGVPRRVRRTAPAVFARRLQSRAHPQVHALVLQRVGISAGLRVAVRADGTHHDRVVDSSRERHSLPDHLLEDCENGGAAGRSKSAARRRSRYLRRPLQSASFLRAPADCRVVATGTYVIADERDGNASRSALGQTTECRRQPSLSDCVFEHPILSRHVCRSSTSTGLSQLQVSERRAHHPTAEALVDQLSEAGVRPHHGLRHHDRVCLHLLPDAGSRQPDLLGGDDAGGARLWPLPLLLHTNQ